MKHLAAAARRLRAFLISAVRQAPPRSRTDGPSHAEDDRSSVTDVAPYVEFCARAATDDEVFRTFRRDPVYVATLEHVSPEQGAEYLRLVQGNSPHLINQLDVVRGNDRWGSPRLVDYPDVGQVSPVTLRYLKVVSDLERLFGDLSGKRVVEIGGGYGGQARLIMETWSVASYTIVDLEPVLRLARRYLTASGTYPPLKTLSPDGLRAGDYDLCISNYAFSELERVTQDLYAELIVTRSLRGYMTCNFISAAFNVDSWRRDELSRLSPDARWLPEEPLTAQENAILVWGGPFNDLADS